MFNRLLFLKSIKLFNFLKNDEWWKGKVQSTEKLRKQMEQLLEKSRFNKKDKKTRII